MNLIDKIYGLILSSIEEKEMIMLFNSISPEWNRTSFYKDLYRSIEWLIEDKQKVNILSISNRMREKGIFNTSVVLEISKLTSNLPSDALLTIGQTLGAIEYQTSLERAKRTIRELSDLTEGDNYTESKFLDVFSSASEAIKSKSIDIIDNIELISRIMIKHDAVKNGETFGLTLPYNTLKNAIILEEVDVMVVGARPAMGKSAFAVSVAVELARKSKFVAIFALEMSAEQVMRRIIGTIAKVDTFKIKMGELNEDEERSVYNAQGNPLLKFITIFEGSHNIRQITNKVNDLKMNNGLDLYIVDYLQKIVSTKASGSRYEQVTENSNKIKVISQNLKVPCLALAQIGRDSAKAGRLPSLSDLRDSGEIEQDASVVAFIHRPEYYGEELTSNSNDSNGICEFLIAKNREGVIDTFELSVDLSTSTFSDINTYDQWKENADLSRHIDYTDNNFKN